MFPSSPSTSSTSTAAPEAARPRPRLPSFSDGVGDRVLVFDQKTASWMELLRFKREFSHARGFFNAIKQRIDQLQALSHDGLAKARAVEWLAGGEGLALVSVHTPGKRLSELTADARGPQFAKELIGQIGPALAALHAHDPKGCHGAITADRIVVTPEGRLVLAESVVGAGLNVLQLAANRLQSEMQVAVPFGPDPVLLDARGDVIQLGMVALSLLLGRRIDPADFPLKVSSLLVELAGADSQDTPDARVMHEWLGRALQVGDDGFANGIEANDAFKRALEAAPAPVAKPAAAPMPATTIAVEAKHVPDTHDDDNARVDAKRVVAMKLPTAASAPVNPPVAEVAMAAHAPEKTRKRSWLTIGFGTLAAGEAAVIAALFLYVMPSFSATSITLAAPPQLPSALALVATVPTLPQQAVTPAPAPEPPAPAAVPTPTPAPAAPVAPLPPVAGRVGGVRVSAPFDLQVFENGTLLGTTAGPIALNEGQHTLELVNETLAFRFKQNVSVKAGALSPMAITAPSGRININAVPWATVTIDGAPAGDTPLANLAIPIGTHEVVFSHPQFGTQKQTVVVKADTPARVSATMQRSGGGQ